MTSGWFQRWLVLKLSCLWIKYLDKFCSWNSLFWHLTNGVLVDKENGLGFLLYGGLVGMCYHCSCFLSWTYWTPIEQFLIRLRYFAVLYLQKMILSSVVLIQLNNDLWICEWWDFLVWEWPNLMCPVIGKQYPVLFCFSFFKMIVPFCLYVLISCF